MQWNNIKEKLPPQNIAVNVFFNGNYALGILNEHGLLAINGFRPEGIVVADVFWCLIPEAPAVIK